MDLREALQILDSTTCPACGKVKRQRMVFCTECYYTLSPGDRGALYRRVGAGFQEAYEYALAILTDDQERAAIAAEGASR